MWPGIRRAVTQWQPAVRGHVTSIFMRQPITASITYTPNLFFEGEKTWSRARFESARHDDEPDLHRTR